VRDTCPDVESHCLIEPSAEIDMAVSFGVHAISQIASVCAGKWQKGRLAVSFCGVVMSLRNISYVLCSQERVERLDSDNAVRVGSIAERRCVHRPFGRKVIDSEDFRSTATQITSAIYY
jgi:hypothetical protein